MTDDTRLSLLVALRGSDDRDAWGLFARRYGDVIRRWCLERCRRLGASDADAASDEVAAEIVAGIRERMTTYTLSGHRPGRFRAWLRRVAHNALSDYLEKAARHQGSGRSVVLEALAEREAPDSLGDALVTECRREVFNEVILPRVREEMGGRWAAVEALGLGDGRAGTGETAAAVAHRFGMSPTALLKLKSRALARLRELVEQWEGDGAS